MQSYYQQIQCTSREMGQDSVGACATHMRSARHSNAILLSANGSSGADATTSMENMGEQVYV